MFHQGLSCRKASSALALDPLRASSSPATFSCGLRGIMDSDTFIAKATFVEYHPLFRLSGISLTTSRSLSKIFHTMQAMLRLGFSNTQGLLLLS